MPKHVVYTREIMQEAVAASLSYAGVIRYLGRPQAGGTQSHIKRVIQQLDIDTSHFTGRAHNKGKASLHRLDSQDILVSLPPLSNKTKTYKLRRALLDAGVEYKCVGCGITDEWNLKPIVLEIDHINGNNLDNRKENLRFLCPNCHSQQDNGKPWKNYKPA